MSWLGLDIGGANLKAADGRGWARSVPFALWREPAGLARAIGELLEAAPPAEHLAVTMTGELCDCFRTKAEGVRHILDAVDKASAGRDVWIYLVNGQLVAHDEAREKPQLAAASNWHALANFACRFIEESERGFLIDIGSTTTDIVPLASGRPVPLACSDTERLVAGELVYTGVGRTPICAVVKSLPWRGRDCPVAAELFATTADAYVMLGDLPERPEAAGTADGRPLTLEYSRERLARMICADRTLFSPADAMNAAHAIRNAQLTQLRNALFQVIERQPQSPGPYIVSGTGEFLARLLIAECHSSATRISLGDRLGPAVSGCAPAHALAVFADESEFRM